MADSNPLSGPPLTLTELAALLGISYRHAHHLVVEERAVLHFRIGRAVRIPAEEAARLIASVTVEAVA